MQKNSVKIFFLVIVFSCMVILTVHADVTVNGHTYQWANWNGGGVMNGPPSNDVEFSVDEMVTVTYLDSYHYNNGKGVASPGTLTLIDDNGNSYGPYQMESIENNNVIWHLALDEGEVVLPSGTYTVENSDPDTWSNNADSDYAGFFGINWKAYDSGASGDNEVSEGISGKWISELAGDMEFVQKGNTVTGTYGADNGRLSGTLNAYNQLKGTWAEAPTYAGDKDSGSFTFSFSDDFTSFHGTYNYGTAPGFAGEWFGKKV